MCIFCIIFKVYASDTPVSNKSYVNSTCLRVGVGVYWVCSTGEVSSNSYMGVGM